MSQRAVDVLQQSVQGVSDDSDLVVRIGVVRLHPGGDAMLITGEPSARDLRGGGGNAAQRPQCIADHQRGKTSSPAIESTVALTIRRAISLFARASEAPTTSWSSGPVLWLLTRYEPRLPSVTVRTWPSRQGCALTAATTSGVAGRGSSSKKTAEPITSPWWITAMRLPAFCPVKPNIACSRSPWWPDSPCWYLVSE